MRNVIMAVPAAVDLGGAYPSQTAELRYSVTMGFKPAPAGNRAAEALGTLSHVSSRSRKGIPGERKLECPYHS